MDETPAALFDAYEADFLLLIQGIRQKLESDHRGEQRKASLRKVEVELDDADDIVSQLEVEMQGIPQSIKGPYVARLKQAHLDLVKYKRLAKDLHAQTARTDLIGSARATSDDPYGESSDRTRLLAGTEVLSGGSRRIGESTRIALESEDQGADILRNLRAQREQIENSRNTLQSADISIDRASGTVNKMIRQMYKQRVLIGAIIVFFVILIAIILYFKLVRR